MWAYLGTSLTGDEEVEEFLKGRRTDYTKLEWIYLISNVIAGIACWVYTYKKVKRELAMMKVKPFTGTSPAATVT